MDKNEKSIAFLGYHRDIISLFKDKHDGKQTDTTDVTAKFIPLDGTKFDILLLNPPFHSNNDYDSSFLLQSLQRLSPNGQCACIVSNGLLSRARKDDILFRKKLLTEMDLHTIILLPENTFLYAKAFSVLLHFSNTRPSQNDINLIDLRNSDLSNDNLSSTLLAGVVSPQNNIDTNLQKLNRLGIKSPRYLLHPDYYSSFPKRDKQNTSFPKNDMTEVIMQEIDKIFSDSFPNSTTILSNEKNELPKGKKSGRELFTLKSGKKLSRQNKNVSGSYPLYQGKGICGTTNVSNVSEFLPTLIINRVGSYCGRIFYTDRPCYVQSNSMYLSYYNANFNPIFLLFLFRAANFNRWKQGTAIPSIRQDAIYDTFFIIPPLVEQAEFVKLIAPQMQIVFDIWNDSYMEQEVLF